MLFGCKVNYVHHIEIMKIFQELCLTFLGKKDLAAIKGVSLKCLNAYIIVSGCLPTGHLDCICLSKLGNSYHGKYNNLLFGRFNEMNGGLAGGQEQVE